MIRNVIDTVIVRSLSTATVNIVHQLNGQCDKALTSGNYVLAKLKFFFRAYKWSD